MEEDLSANERLKEKLTKENLWIYVLRLLQERPMYGYEIRREIKERFNFTPAAVTSYVVLYKLKKEELVTEEWHKNESGKPDRKYYVITEKGQRAMSEAKKFIKNILDSVFDKTK
ncbi:MAG: PadR family transcriptional regulator [Candidatus Asgardarchaeia archaeon]